MAEADTSQHELQMLSASAHTPESFGRAIISAALAAAAENGGSGGRQPIKMQLDVTVTPIRGIGAWVCIGIPGFRRICTIEREDSLD
jgi:hypothetical protein